LNESGFFLELGVAAATYVLNATGAATISSCHGHGRDVSYVLFWPGRSQISALLESAAAADVGLENASDDGMGYAVVYSDDLFGLFRFALELQGRTPALGA
jgi:hypothetical protein